MKTKERKPTAAEQKTLRQAHAEKQAMKKFYAKLQKAIDGVNLTPGFVVPDVALINSVFSSLTGISVLESDTYVNLFPIDSGSSGNVASVAQYTSQDTENTLHDANGNTVYKNYRFSFEIPVIGGGGGINTGYDYATFPLYNTHTSITSDPWLQTEVVDLLDGIYNAHVNPSYTGPSWGTPRMPYHSIEHAAGKLQGPANRNHVDTIVLSQGQHEFAESPPTTPLMNASLIVTAGAATLRSPTRRGRGGRSGRRKAGR